MANKSRRVSVVTLKLTINMIVQAVLVASSTILFGFYLFLKSRYNYWKNKNVPHLKPVPIVGNYGKYLFFKKNIGETEQEICRQFPNEPYFGAYYGTEPTLIIQDPILLKTVMTKDYYYFSNREVDNYNNRETATKNMFFSGGDKWRVIRQNMTPVFTSAKMKNMFYLIENCCYELERLLDAELSESNQVEAKFLMTRYTMGCIGSCAFGVNTNTMEGLNDSNMFLMISKAVVNDSYSQVIKFYMRSIWPALFYAAKRKVLPEHVMKSFHNFLVNVFKSRDYSPSTRNDFVDLVLNFVRDKYVVGDSIKGMKAGYNGNEKVKLEVDDDFLVSQCMLLFVGGFETSATTSSFTLYELAKNQKAQRRVHAEIDTFLENHNNKVTYDCVSEMPYLDACIDETLRLYPVLGVLTREVVEDYKLPTGLTLEKKMRVHIPVHHLHRNPDYFPEPEQYKPERFYAENKKDIKPYTYIPFGEGPRICLGLRFAKMQMTAGLITFLKKYNVELAEGMLTTPKLEPKSLVVKCIGGINLKCTPREGWENRVFEAKI